MKARKKNSNDEWKEIKYVQLEDSDILYKERYLEFEHDTLSTELKTFTQIDEEKHWQGIKEQAAIAAMQGMFSNPELITTGTFDTYYHIVVNKAVLFAERLVQELKKKGE